MLEDLEILSGMIFLGIYMAMTIFLPLSLVGVTVYGIVLGIAAALRIPVSLLGEGASLISGQKAAANPKPRRPARWQRWALTLVPWALTLGGLLFVVQLITSRPDSVPVAGEGGTPSWITRSLAISVGAYAELQDQSMRFWTSYPLGEVLQQSTGQHWDALGLFGRLTATRLYDWLQPNIGLEEFRWSIASVIAAALLIVLFIGRPKFGREE